MILHTLKTSPFQTLALKSCLDILSDSDLLLLIEDGVIASSTHHDAFPQLQKLAFENRLFVLNDDLSARGITNKIGKESNYDDFVDLVIACKSQMSW